MARRSASPTRSWPSCCRGRSRTRRPEPPRLRERQRELEHGATRRMGGAGERPAVPLDDGAGGGQTQAGVLLPRAGLVRPIAEEALEDAPGVLGRDAGTVIADADE